MTLQMIAWIKSCGTRTQLAGRRKNRACGIFSTVNAICVSRKSSDPCFTFKCDCG
jgi:hypothetical protein